jgi:hypothetical protein
LLKPIRRQDGNLLVNNTCVHNLSDRRNPALRV